MNYILAFDVGTQSTKAVLIGTDGKVYATHEEFYEFLLPKPGWVEQRPSDYWQTICDTTKGVCKTLDFTKEKVLAMVFSTQAMGIIPVSADGEILHNNISWVDGRASVQAKKIMKRFLGEFIFEKISGVVISGKDVIPKLLWLKENEPDIYNKTHKFLDVNGYLKFMCTGKMFAEWSGASSYAFNIKKKDWEHLFFKIAGIDNAKLPDLVSPTDLVGTLTEKAANELGLPQDVKVFGGCDDTQSAAIGSTQTKHNQGHIYLGSSAWIGVSIDDNHTHKNGVACLTSANPKSNLLVGITESAGVNIEWALEKFYSKEKEDGINIYDLMEKEVAEVASGADNLIFTPWFQGERTPITSTTIRSTIFNLSLEHGRGHIMRALLEGIGYNLLWTINNIKRDYKIELKELVVIGGGSQNDAWMQSLSNILNCPLRTTTEPKMAGAIGCAMTAFVGLGIDGDFSKIINYNPIYKSFTPQKEHQAVYQEMFKSFKNVYKSLKKPYIKINLKRFNY